MSAALAPDIRAERPPRSATADLAQFAITGTVPPEVVTQAVPLLIDTLAVMVAGGAEEQVGRLAASLPGASGPGAVPSLWTDAQYRDDDAALLFGMASHILDYDDVSMLAVCHPSVPILSALVAGLGGSPASGRGVIEAFAIGTEVLIRLGQAMGFRHYDLGFHATATLGTMGATAALARLRGLDEGRTRHALAIAASQASGVRANFGSMVKSLHVGIAAANAVRAVRLAKAGIEGATEAIEGSVGFLHAFSGGATTAWPSGLMLGAPFAIGDPGFEQKRYPCCYMLHKMIEGALALRRDTGLDLDAAASIRVDVPKGGTSALIHPYPKSGLNALFSGPYAIAAALADGRIDLASFTDEAVLRPSIQRRLTDVTLVESDKAPAQGSDVGGAPVTVTITPRSGAPVARTVTLSPGSLADPITPEQLRAKWLDCLRRAKPDLTPDSAAALFDEAARLPESPDATRLIATIAGAIRRTP
jgi:2-methylcitrate dehydratase PrpD